MTKTTMSTAAESLLDYVRKRDYVSLHQATQVLAQHIETKGDLALELRGYKNVMLWAGWSQQALDALNGLLAARLVHWQSTSSLVYLADGCLLKYPVAKSLKSFKSPRWFPVVLRPGQDKKATPVEVAP